MSSAFEEALAKIKDGESEPSNSSLPSYVVASDTLSMANGNQTFLESAVDAVEAIPQFIGTSIISGVNQIYNIPADVGNLFGGDFERSDTSEVMSSIDSNLGVFYGEHKEGVDLVGFMLSSVVPGTAGIKVLNAGQKSLRTAITTGKFGNNTGKALGLLAPQKQVFIDRALKEVVTSSSAASLTSGNALRAIGSGLGQNTLEALAFEVAVTATLFNSPVLENQDFGDFMINVAFGAGIMGIVGGTVDAVKISSGLRQAADKAAIEARPWTAIPEAAAKSSHSERLVLDYEVLNDIPVVPAALESTRKQFLQKAAETKANTLNLRIKTGLKELSDGDREVSETLFQAFKVSDIETKQSAFIGLQGASKFNVSNPLTARAEKLTARLASSKASLKEIDEITEELAKSDLSTAYVKAWGEDVGVVMSDKPTVTSLMDTLKKGEVIKVKPSGVTAGSKKFPFDLRFNTGSKIGRGTARPWNILAVDPFEAQARYIWAANLKPLAPTAKKPLNIHVDDIPLMEKVLSDVNPQDYVHINFKGLKEGELIDPLFYEFLSKRKLVLANKIHKIGGGAKNQDEIAAIVNVRSSLLSGEVRTNATNTYDFDDMLAMQSHAESYTKKLIAQGTRKEADGIVDIWAVPQTIKLTYDSKPFVGVNNFVVENMAIIKEQQKLYQEATSRSTSFVIGKELYDQLPDISSGRVLQGAVPSGSGPGFASAASHNYGTVAAAFEQAGNVTSRAIKAEKDGAREVLEPLLYKLANNQKAAIEWRVVEREVRSIEGEYGINAAGDALEPLLMVRWKAAAERAAAAGEPVPKQPILPNPAMKPRIELRTDEVRNLAKAHVEVNGDSTNKLAVIRTAQGVQFNRSPDAFYPIPINTKDFPFFATVTDDSITSGNHTKTLFASSADELDGMIGKLKDNPHLTIRTKGEAEAFFKAEGTWDYEKTLSNNYLDVEAHRKGVSAPFLVATDPEKITSDFLSWHMQRKTGLVREAVAAKYEVQFEELRRLGDEATNVGTSTFGDVSLLKFAEDVVANPFADYIKTALAIKKGAEYPWWVNANRMADSAISKMYKKVDEAWIGSKSANDLEGINTALKQAGYKGAAYDESMTIFANAEPAKGVLASAVQKANSVLATIVLRWDTLNAVNNAVSANVLLGAETKAVIRAISRGDSEAVGALADLTRIKVPGTGETIMSPTKLIGNAIAKFNRDGVDFKFYKDNGYMTSISDQYKGALDELSFNPKDSATSWDSKINGIYSKLKTAGDVGERLTGNKLAEEFNRFVAADVMKQMTDVAVNRNLMSAKEQLAYINTFVNRTQGNYLAAQRPMMFQGPIGQAIGLFQTYQFNLIQQLLRHVGEGHGKDAMTLLALQGTIHGMNGLPAFNAVNTHLIGTASGNTEHKDAYSTVYGVVGKEAGDWLMYGAASNAMGLLHPDLKVNLYTRGDINPRHLTIVPTDPSQVPIVQATGKVFANIFKVAKTLGAGGDISSTLLQGMEHNSISRPLAGLAQTLQGLDNPLATSYSTSKRGNVIASNDLFSLANLGRVVGGKPLDEAIALDATYRFKSYALKDTKRRQTLGAAIKSNMIAGREPTQEQIEQFAFDYAKAGGRQQEFNKWFTQLYKDANLSQSNKIQQSLTSPFTQSMQKIMGGRELRDFTEN